MPNDASPTATHASAPDVIPIRRAAATEARFDPPSTKGYAFVRSDADGNATGGYANGTTAWTTTTPMHLGFAGEAVTHVVALRMVQDGFFGLHDKVMTLLGRDAPLFADVTVGQVLRHRSGMSGVTDTVDPGVGPGDLGTLNAYISSYLSMNGVPTPRPSPPFERNFIDTTLLQSVLETKLSSAYSSYADYVQRAVLTTLGIASTEFKNGSILAADARTQAYPSADGDALPFDWEGQGFFAWYNWVATPAALLRFVTGVRTNRAVLNASSFATLVDGRTAWRTARNGEVTYFGGNNTWTLGSNPSNAGLAVAAATYAPQGGTAVDAVYFANSPDHSAMARVVNAAMTS